MSLGTHNRVGGETPNAKCLVCEVCCATWRTEDAEGDGYWMLDACDDFGQRWIVERDDLLAAVVLLGGVLDVDWEGG